MTSDGKTINQGNPDSKYNDPDYIRVSEFLKFIPKGERIVRWQYKFKSYAEMMQALRKSAERGSWVDNYVKEQLLGTWSQDIPEEYAGYARAYSKFRENWNIEVQASDQEVSDPDYKYVGTMDIRGTLFSIKNPSLDPKTYVIDVKTGEPTMDDMGNLMYEVFPVMHYQTASYRKADLKMGNASDGTAIIRLFSDGNYVFQVDGNEEKSFQVAMAALALRRLTGKIT